MRISKKKFGWIIFIFFLFTCFSPLYASQNYSKTTKKIVLNDKWKFLPDNFTSGNHYLNTIDDESWQNIQVPSNWYLQGHEHAGVAWYRYQFAAPIELGKKIVKIVFEGIDYSADIWLNETHIGYHEGSFQSFSFNISDTIKPGKENILVVRVNSPNESPEAWSLNKRLIKGIFSHHDTRPGGAWSLRGQEKNTGGIWGSVYLSISEDLSIEKVLIKPSINLSDNSVDAHTKIEITNYSSKTRSVSAHLTLTPKNFSSTKYTTRQYKIKLKPGVNHINLNFAQSPAKLWWPYEYGNPNLYTLHINIKDKQRILDSIEEDIGFRTVEYQTETGYWLINGKRLFLRGTNYISTQWLSEMNNASYAFDIQLMKRAHINTVRVHAHLEDKEFYKLADASGLLIWQDFPLQWGYADTHAFKATAKKQAVQMVEGFYNHASIIAWSLHNEPPWDADWMKYKYPDYNPEQNKKLDEELYQVVKELDSTRHVHAYSATSEHPWLGWYTGHWQDYAKPTSLKLISEYGAQALPDIQSLRRIFTEEELWPDNKREWSKWDYHNFQKKETFENAKVSMGNNIHEFIANTQQYQAKLTQFATEAYRRQKYNPVGGIFQFMFVEDWPSINWGIVDYWRNPKPGYYALQTGFQPILPSIEWYKDHYKKNEPVILHLWVINDLDEIFPAAKLTYTLHRNGVINTNSSLTIDIKADSAKRVYTWQRKSLAPGNYELHVKLSDSNKKILGLNQFNFSVD